MFKTILSMLLGSAITLTALNGEVFLTFLLIFLSIGLTVDSEPKKKKIVRKVQKNYVHFR